MGGGGGSSNVFATDITVNGLTVGRGDGNVATNTAFGVDAIGSPLATSLNVNNVGVGYNTLNEIASAVGSLTILNGGNYPTFGDDLYSAQLVYLSGTPVLAGGVLPTITFDITSNTVTSITAINNPGKGWIATDTVFTLNPIDFPSPGPVFTCQISSLLSAANNTALGYNAGNTAITNSNSTYIGYNAKGLGSNEIAIGANSVGSGNNTTTIGSATTTSCILRGNASVTNINGTGTVTFQGTTSNIAIGSLQSTGRITLGRSTATGDISIGIAATSNQTVNIQSANQESGTRTLNLGGGSTFGGTTTVNIGPTGGTFGFTSNINIGRYTGSATDNINIGYDAGGGTIITIGSGNSPTVNIRGLINLTGVFKPPSYVSAPTYVRGAVYFDVTLNKLRVGGATGWETITSA